MAAGDRFETLRPGYATVAAQLPRPRRKVAIQGLSLTPDRRTLVLATAPQVEASSYAIALPASAGLKAEASRKPRESEGKCRRSTSPTTSAASRLAWQPSNGPDTDAWSAGSPISTCSRRPVVDSPSARHEELWPKLGRPGNLTLRTQLNLKDVLRPAFQPGSKSDAELLPNA